MMPIAVSAEIISVKMVTLFNDYTLTSVHERECFIARLNAINPLEKPEKQHRAVEIEVCAWDVCD